jgi:hypothetical protein
MKRREFITLIGGAVAWPLAARAQQAAMPVIGFVDLGSAVASAHFAAAFRNGLNETGYSDGKNLTVEYHWLEGRYDRLPALMTELVGRRVAVIATPISIPASLAARLRQRRSRSSSASARIRSSSVWSPILRGPAAMRRASTFSSARWCRSDWGCCAISCPQPSAWP